MLICPGSVDASELKKAFEKMDVHVTDKEVDLLLKRWVLLEISFLLTAHYLKLELLVLIVIMLLFFSYLLELFQECWAAKGYIVLRCYQFEWGAVHMIPGWLSFQNELIPPPYISLHLFTIPRRNSVPAQVIPEWVHSSFLIRMKFSFWYDISFWCHVSCKWTPFRNETRKPRSLGQVAHAYHFQDGAQNCRFQDDWRCRFWHVNAIRTSFWNKTHSGMKLILVSCEQNLTWFRCRHWTGFFSFFIRKCNKMAASGCILESSQFLLFALRYFLSGEVCIVWRYTC